MSSRYAKVKVAELKTFCRALKLPLKGAKKDLLERLDAATTLSVDELRASVQNGSVVPEAASSARVPKAAQPSESNARRAKAAPTARVAKAAQLSKAAQPNESNASVSRTQPSESNLQAPKTAQTSASNASVLRAQPSAPSAQASKTAQPSALNTPKAAQPSESNASVSNAQSSESNVKASSSVDFRTPKPSMKRTPMSVRATETLDDDDTLDWKRGQHILFANNGALCLGKFKPQYSAKDQLKVTVCVIKNGVVRNTQAVALIPCEGIIQGPFFLVNKKSLPDEISALYQNGNNFIDNAHRKDEIIPVKTESQDALSSIGRKCPASSSVACAAKDGGIKPVTLFTNDNLPSGQVSSSSLPVESGKESGSAKVKCEDTPAIPMRVTCTSASASGRSDKLPMQPPRVNPIFGKSPRPRKLPRSDDSCPPIIHTYELDIRRVKRPDDQYEKSDIGTDSEDENVPKPTKNIPAWCKKLDALLSGNHPDHYNDLDWAFGNFVVDARADDISENSKSRPSSVHYDSTNSVSRVGSDWRMREEYKRETKQTRRDPTTHYWKRVS